jgi:hypothetical protein
MLMDSSRTEERRCALGPAERIRTPAHASLDITYSCQAGAEHFQQSAKFLPFGNRGLGSLA